MFNPAHASGIIHGEHWQSQGKKEPFMFKAKKEWGQQNQSKLIGKPHSENMYLPANNFLFDVSNKHSLQKQPSDRRMWQLLYWE